MAEGRTYRDEVRPRDGVSRDGECPGGEVCRDGESVSWRRRMHSLWFDKFVGRG